MLIDYTDESEVTQYLPKTVTTSSGKKLPIFDVDGKVIASNLPSVVPGQYIAQADYQGDREIFACLDIPLMIDGQEIRPPSLGVWSLLEAFKCPFVNQFGTGLDLIHCFRALYINEYRESIASSVYNWIYEGVDEFDMSDDTTWSTFDEAVLEYAANLSFDIKCPEHWYAIRMFFDMSFNGYAMIPPSGGGSAFLFGAETMGSVIAGIGSSFNMSINELLWETPMILLGHTTAATARNNGTKGVSRPKDPKDVRKQLILATAREYKGELHPWQIADPLKRKLTDIQARSKSAVNQFEKLRKEAAKNAGIKLPKV